MFSCCFCIVSHYIIDLCLIVGVSNARQGHMSKDKTATAATKADKVKEAHASVIAHVAKLGKASVKRFARPLPLIMTAILLAAYYLDHASTASTAILYMIAENGKKSGRADGNVYLRNGVIRAMAIPRLVQNGFTSAARSAFGQLSAAFRSLSQANQNLWINTKGFFKSDRFGRPVEITGKALYNMLNGNLIDIGVAPISVPPLPAAVKGITSLTVSADVSSVAMDLDYDPTPTDAGVIHKIFATAPQGSGINRPGKSIYRFIGLLPAGTATSFDIWSMYVAKYGAPAAGFKVFVKLVPVNSTTGQAGAAILASTTVVP